MFFIILSILDLNQAEARPINETQELDYEIEAMIRNATNATDPDLLLEKISQHTAIIRNLTANIDTGSEELRQAEEVVHKGYAAYLYLDFNDVKWFRKIQKLFKWSKDQIIKFRNMLLNAEDEWIELVKKYSHKTYHELHF